MKKIIKFRLLLTTLLLSGGMSLSAQTFRVTGVVSDSEGPLAGAGVSVKGTTNGTLANADGRFAIDVSSGQTLTFSFMGYTNQEIPITNQTTVNVTLESKSVAINEIVLIGYGVQRRSDVTGAIASVKRDELLSTPSSSVGDMLRGRVTGLQVTSVSGRPGAEPSILIRGRRSIADTDSRPLFIIDGSVATGEEFNTLNAEDIASVEVLKDAAAQAVYGARAANGVILVTTLRGQSGKTIVNLNSSIGFGTLNRNFDFFSPEEWMGLRAEAKSSILRGDDYREASSFTYQEILNDDKMIKAYENGEIYDWEKLMFGTAVSQKYDLSVRGGNDKLKIATGLGYINQDGILKYNSGYQRLNLRLNVDYDVYKWLSVGFNYSFMTSKEKRENGNFNTYITRPPYGQMYDENGNYEQFLTSSSERNPLFSLAHYNRRISTDQSRINAFVNVKPFKNFSYRFNVSYFNRTQEDGAYQGSQANEGSNGGSGSLTNNTRQMYLIENIFNYSVPIANTDHNLSLTAVQSYDKDIAKSLGYRADNIPVDTEEGWNMLPDGTISDPIRGVDELLLISFLGRAQYSFKDKYLISAALRHDGSSKFGKNSKWGTFPSIALGWRASEEKLLKDIRQISNLKLRASYGIVGNQNGIPSYTTLGLADAYQMEFGNQTYVGYLPSRALSDPNLKWENTAQLNIGLDFGLFDNRLTGTFEHYRTKTQDLLLNRQINAALGYDRVFTNIGETKTEGWEFSLSGDIIRQKDLQWNVSANLSTTRNEIVSLTGLRDENGNQVNDIVNGWFIGKPIMVYYDYAFDGIFQLDEFEETDVKNVYKLKPTIDSDNDGILDKTIEYPYGVEGPQPGMVKMKDLDGDGKITPEGDRKTISRDPKFIYSVSSSLNYKGFDLFLDFYSVQGAKILNPYLYNYDQGGALRGRYNGVKMDYWTPTNPSNTFPRPKEDVNPQYQVLAAYQDASYFRLRTLSLGYTLPDKLLQKVSIDKLRIYATMTNVFTITDFKSYSPELIQGQYPELRQLLFGLNLTF